MKKRMILWTAFLAISQVLTGVTQAFVLCIEDGGGISIAAALDCVCRWDDDVLGEVRTGPNSPVASTSLADDCGPCTDIPLATDDAYVAQTDLRSKFNLSDAAMKAVVHRPAMDFLSTLLSRKSIPATPNAERLPIYLKSVALLI